MMAGVPVALMLATLTERRVFGEDFLLERKFDGERCMARRDGGELWLESRTGNDLTRTYPEVRAAVAAQRPRRLLLDGEVVAYDGDQTSFSRLQQRLGVKAPSVDLVASYPVVYCVFDLLEIDGVDLTERPLLERRARLIKAIRPGAALQLSEAWRGDSEERFGAACRSGWEGLIAKRADAPYTRGRSKDWLKLKCSGGQEFVIGGYTDPAGSRTDFGALLVGYYDDGRLFYAGKVGTGYSKTVLRTLGVRLRDLRRPCRRLSRGSPLRAAPTGPAPSSSPRSAFRNGQAAVGCASRASSGCGTTRRRPTSSARYPSEREPR
jgi:bifunctional non-homologous end joining protein LigD